MQFDELIKLVREVGNAGLSSFEYKEGELHIKMSAIPKKNPGSPEMRQNGRQKPPVYEPPQPLSPKPADKPETGEDDHEGNDQRKREVFESPLEGIFRFSRLDDTPCPVNIGDYINLGQVIGKLYSRGHCYEIFSTVEGEVVNVYIVDGEEIVAREPIFMVAADG